MLYNVIKFVRGWFLPAILTICLAACICLLCMKLLAKNFLIQPLNELVWTLNAIYCHKISFIQMDDKLHMITCWFGTLELLVRIA